MATRFYFPSNNLQPEGFSASIDSGWDYSVSVDAGIGKGLLVTVKVGSPAGTLSEANGTGIANDDSIMFQYCSSPVVAQSIAGNVKGQITCFCEDPDMDAYSQLSIRVCSGDGSVIRGTLLAMHSAALSSEWRSPSGLRNRKFPLASLSPATLSSVDAQDGDRILIEGGFRSAGTVVSDGHMQIRDNQGALDLPENELAATGDPWIEFSQTIEFEGGGIVTPPSGININYAVHRLATF